MLGFDFTGATSSVLTGVNNSVNNNMTIVGYAEAAQSSPVGIQMDFSFDPATGARRSRTCSRCIFRALAAYCAD